MCNASPSLVTVIVIGPAPCINALVTNSDAIDSRESRLSLSGKPSRIASRAKRAHSGVRAISSAKLGSVTATSPATLTALAGSSLFGCISFWLGSG